MGRNRIEHKVINGTECKFCSACKGWLPLSSFDGCKSRWDGLQRYDRRCKSIYNKIWYKKKKQEKKSGDMKLTYKERRRAKEKLLPHKFTRSDWYATIRYFGHRCAYCGIKFSKKNPATREHVIPICKNGPTVKWNVVSACGKCNSSKNGYTMETWYRSQSFFTEERLAKIYRWAAENYQYDIFDEEVFA